MLRSLRGRPRLRALLAALLLVGFVPAATSCFGGFHLTRKVYDFNKQVDEDRWIQWVAFLVMNVVPVYPFALWFDALFANSVEFWTGENPVVSSADPPTRVVRTPDGGELRAVRLAPRRFRLEWTRPSGETRSWILARDAGAAVARRADTGEVVARVAGREGRPALAPLP